MSIQMDWFYQLGHLDEQFRHGRHPGLTPMHRARTTIYRPSLVDLGELAPMPRLATTVLHSRN